MAHETFASTGLTRECYERCPHRDFPAAARAIETFQADVALAEQHGLSEHSLLVLRKQEARATASGERLARQAVGACVLGSPWKCPIGSVCGDTAVISMQTIVLDPRAKTPNTDLERLTFHRPDSQATACTSRTVL